MNKLYRSLSILAAITLFITACSTQAAQAQPAGPAVREAITYKTVLGKSLTDQEVVDFIARNHCSRTGQFQQCKQVGIALWINLEQVVETVHLYLNNTAGFAPYKGELPFGLKFYDTMGAVEYKLERQLGEGAGSPDEGSSPDHFHYWAVYRQLGMTTIYNSPFVDEDALIYAILVSR
jgi:hypothetical protein